MKKDLLIKKIECLLNATPFGSVDLPEGKRFQIKEFNTGDEMIAIKEVGINDRGQSQVTTSDDFLIDLQDLTYRELELVHKAIK